MMTVRRALRYLEAIAGAFAVRHPTGRLYCEAVTSSGEVIAIGSTRAATIHAARLEMCARVQSKGLAAAERAAAAEGGKK